MTFHQSSYWTRWVMGVIAGILLSQILCSILFAGPADNQPKELAYALCQPALALLGGYSADRFIGAIDSLLGASQRPAAKAMTEAARV